jgi:hypothetical protein
MHCNNARNRKMSTNIKPYNVIQARDLKPGMWLYFKTTHHMLVGDVNDTRDGDILVRCDYGDGSATATEIFEADDNVCICADK